VSLSLSDLRTRTRFKADESSAAGFVTDAQLDLSINKGCRFVYRRLSQKFENLFIKIGFTEDIAAASINTATDVITVARSYASGDPVVYTAGTTVAAGLTSLSTYYAIRVTATTIKLAATLELSLSGTAIDITSAGAGTHSISRGRFSTVASTQAYDLPPEMMKLVRIEYRQSGSTSDNDWRKVPHLNISSDDGSNYYPLREGYLPEFGYAMVGNQVIFKPVPSQAYAVRIWDVPLFKKLVGTTDVPGFDEDYCELACELAAIDLLGTSGEPIFGERMKLFEVENGLLNETSVNRDQQPDQMVITDTGGNDRYGR